MIRIYFINTFAELFDITFFYLNNNFIIFYSYTISTYTNYISGLLRKISINHKHVYRITFYINCLTIFIFLDLLTCTILRLFELCSCWFYKRFFFCSNNFLTTKYIYFSDVYFTITFQ